MESYFYKQRGCQYLWNVYEELDIPICTNFTEIHYVIHNLDRNKGYRRENFPEYERTMITKKECLPPCFVTHYATKFERWARKSIPNRSVQIAFSDFVFHHKEEYLSCDTTCIIGELGGNLGFFLGGSILLVLDIIMNWITKMCAYLYKKMTFEREIEMGTIDDRE